MIPPVMRRNTSARTRIAPDSSCPSGWVRPKRANGFACRCFRTGWRKNLVVIGVPTLYVTLNAALVVVRLPSVAVSV